MRVQGRMNCSPPMRREIDCLSINHYCNWLVSSHARRLNDILPTAYRPTAGKELPCRYRLVARLVRSNGAGYGSGISWLICLNEILGLWSRRVLGRFAACSAVLIHHMWSLSMFVTTDEGNETLHMWWKQTMKSDRWAKTKYLLSVSHRASKQQKEMYSQSLRPLPSTFI